MAPIHDTDIASDRWAKAEWEHYELWEKVELKLRRRRWLWIATTVLIFISLSSVPIVLDRSPRWAALGATRKLAEVIDNLKRDSALRHEAFRIRFAGRGRLEYRVEAVANCGSTQPGRPVREGALTSGGALALLSATDGAELGIPGLLETFCYDALGGSELDARGEPLAGFGIVSTADLAEKRIDRVAVLLLRGPNAELAFE